MEEEKGACTSMMALIFFFQIHFHLDVSYRRYKSARKKKKKDSKATTKLALFIS